MLRAFLMLVLCAGAARADTITRSSVGCERGLVEVGDPSAVVRNRCGEPTRAEHREAQIAGARGLVRTTTIDVWTYDHGPRKLVVILTFIDGSLRQIELDGYGTPRP